MMYGYLADGVVAIHVAYVAFVLVGQGVILLGAVLGWTWIRNLWFRSVHLVAIVYVAWEALWGIDCPLTVWEYDLRRLAGQDAAEGSFIGRWLHEILFYDFEPWFFTCAYVAFAIVVFATFVAAPPRWRRTQPA
jgi:hypothetical protein